MEIAPRLGGGWAEGSGSGLGPKFQGLGLRCRGAQGFKGLGVWGFRGIGFRGLGSRFLGFIVFRLGFGGWAPIVNQGR